MNRMLVKHAALGVTVLMTLSACGNTAPRVSSVDALHVDGTEPGGLGLREEGRLRKVGGVTVSDAQPGLIADVAAHPGKPYAYLARWGGEQCPGAEKRGQQLPDGGAYVIDLTNPARPVEVGFIPVHQDTLVGEGLQVATITTPKFSGDILVMNHEGCGKNYKAGFSLVDVSNPLKPKKLAMHEGDFTRDGIPNRPRDANQYHSAFAWDAGDRAYLVATDNEEGQDVDIFDITDPKHPRLISELNVNEQDVAQPEPGLSLTDSFLHDMIVKKIDGRQILLLSYWDGGYVLYDVNDPSRPKFLGDSDYPGLDPELLARGISLSPEGNAHQAEFTSDNRFVIGTDEDFDPYRLQMNTAVGSFLSKTGTNTTVEAATGVSGPTVFAGRACNGDTAVPAGSGGVAVVERGLCSFEEKAQNVIQAGGYSGMVVMNREGADACTVAITGYLQATIPTLFVGRDAGFRMFGQDFDLASCRDSTPQLSGITVGATGATINSVAKQFDGWGYVQLFQVDLNEAGATLTNHDTYAIDEAMQEPFATGHGDLSVHEVATDPRRPNIAYLSYYSGGVRVLEIHEHDGQAELHEVGAYVNPAETFWGIEVWTHPDTNEQYVLASDRNSGLKVFRYTGD